MMTTVKAFIKRRPLLTYFALTFAISWGGILIAAGPGAISPASRMPETLLPFVYLAMLAGPSVAGLLLIGLVSGRAGFRELGGRLLCWRVGARWYAVALLTAPLVWMATLLALSLIAPVFMPAIVTASDRASLLLSGIVAGLVVGFFEELGWTGFAVPRLRLRYGILATGLLVGVVWGAWHFLVFFWGSAIPAGALPSVLVLPVQLFSFLLPYRVLMVWLHDRTESLLVVILMHAGLVVCTLSLAPLALSGAVLVIANLVFAAVLWGVVAAVAVASRRQFSRQPLQRRTA
jgi:membrane protease YdiL (CAAX protease family)